MTEILLAKPKLSSDFIDSSVGEPYIIRKHLFDMFTWDEDVGAVDLSYPFPQGYEPLVKMLEDKHQAPVIITNGAKQALGGAFYSLQKMGKIRMGMRKPYWALIPPLAEMHGIVPTFPKQDVDCHPNLTIAKFKDDFNPKDLDSYLCINPNNPDGWVSNDIENLYLLFESHKIPFIFDGAYYHDMYMQGTYPKHKQLGDVQIYTFSKSLGLSGLRLGYAVCHNTEFYKHMSAYMEAMTVGVSTISQRYLYNLLQSMNQDPELVRSFEERCFLSLLENKKECLNINPEVLELPSNFTDIPGMFGWCKVGPKADFNKAKIHFVGGKLFGAEDMIRINLAFENHVIKDIVNRLNSL